MIYFVNIHQTCLFVWTSQLAFFVCLFCFVVVFSLCMVPSKILRALKVSEDRVTNERGLFLINKSVGLLLLIAFILCCSPIVLFSHVVLNV